MNSELKSIASVFNAHHIVGLMNFNFSITISVKYSDKYSIVGVDLPCNALSANSSQNVRLCTI